MAIQVTTGPDGKPVVNEYGNVKPDMLPTQEKREPLIDKHLVLTS